MIYYQLRNDLWKMFGKKRTYIGFGAFLTAHAAFLLIFRYWQGPRRDMVHRLELLGYSSGNYISNLTMAAAVLVPVAVLLMPLYVALVGGDLLAKLDEGPNVIAREFPAWKTLGAVHAQIGVAPKQRFVIQGRHIVVARIAGVAGVPKRGDDGVDLDHGAAAIECIVPAVQPVEQRATAVGHLLLMIEPGRLAIVDPFERHAGHIGAQNHLPKAMHGSAYDECRIVPGGRGHMSQMALHPCKIRQLCATIQRISTQAANKGLRGTTEKLHGSDNWGASRVRSRGNAR
jgi:hypothetical protein